MDLKKHWVSYNEYFAFVVLPLVSTLPHSTSFVPTLLSKIVRSLSLCRETGSGRLGCCVHLL